MAQLVSPDLVLKAKCGDLKGLQDLLSNGGDPNIRDSEGKTPLIMASSSGQVRIVEFLLSKGADYNIRDESGCTALIRASRVGNSVIVELLLSCGADPNIRDNDGKTALDRAKDWRRQEVIQLLETSLSCPRTGSSEPRHESKANQPPANAVIDSQSGLAPVLDQTALDDRKPKCAPTIPPEPKPNATISVDPEDQCHDGLPRALQACKAAARRGYEIANNNLRESRNAFDNVAKSVSNCLRSINDGRVHTPDTIKQLQKQLTDVVGELNQLQQTAEHELEKSKQRLDLFSVSLFGRTMAGKSTLMEILTNGEGHSIGSGAQRTTRDVRRYSWNGLEVTDVPGVAAFEGADDEEAAFEAARQADLVLFLITDDAPQPVEAECFARVRSLGKPVIGICNVKVALDDEDDFLLFLDAPDDHFQYHDLRGIVRQFHEFADQHVPGFRVPFHFTHLRSRFLANQRCYAEHRSRLIAASRFRTVEAAIVQKVLGHGTFLRIKSFVDGAAKPMMDLADMLLDFSATNSRSGRVLIEKQRQLRNWIERFSTDSFRRIETFVSKEMDALRSQIPSFTEDHYEDSQAGENWKRFIESKAIVANAQKLQQSISDECGQAIKDIARELKSELSLVNTLATDQRIGGMERIFDAKRAWNWGTVLISGGLGIAALVFSGPLGWAAAAVGAIGTIISWFLDDKEKKARDARDKLARRLRQSVDEMQRKLKTALESWFKAELLANQVHVLFRDLDAVTSTLFQLADSQRELAWTLNDRQRVLARTVVEEALRQLGAETVKNDITDVARIPGHATMLLIQPGVRIPGKVKSGLMGLLEESIWFAIDFKNPVSIISQAVGNGCDKKRIGIERNIRVAHVAIQDLTPVTKARIRLAQQLTGLHVMLQ